MKLMVDHPGGRFLASVAATCVAAALLGACAREPEREAAVAPSAVQTLPALTIALLPERNVFEQKKRYQPLQTYLTAALGRPVAFKLLDNYQLVFSEILEQRVDGGFFGSMNGAIAQLKGGIEILARPVDLQGVSTYTGVIFTRPGSGVTRDPATWQGRHIALVNKVTTAGYLYPLSLLRRWGYRGDPAAFFSEMPFTGSHDAAMLSVVKGEADLGACKNTVFNEVLALQPQIGESLSVLAESAPVPSNALGVRPQLDPALKARLREALLSMHEREDGQRALRQFGAQRFVDTSARDYEPVFAMAREAEVDLAGWPLRELR